MTVTKRALLATFSKPELLDIGRHAELDVHGKMTKDDLLDRIAPSERADLARILPSLAYESVKAACKELGLPGDGREKAVFVARLLAAATPAGQPVPQAAARAADDFTIEVSVEPRKPRIAWQGMDRKEAAVSVPTQVVEIVRPGRARNRGATLLNTDVRFASERPSSEPALPPNRLIWTNDNLVALQTLLDEKDPATKGYRYRAQVDLIYIDPPFMVNTDFRVDNTIDIEIDEDAGVEAKKEPSLVEHLAYRDTWRQGLDSFLSMLKRRLELLKELLAPTGSIYVHLDWHAVHYVKVLMDEIFGYENFRNDITWQRTTAHNDPKQFGRITDRLLFYSNSSSYVFQKVPGDYSREQLARFKYVDQYGRYKAENLTAPHLRFGETGDPWRGIQPADSGRCWARPPRELEELFQKGRILTKKDGTPRMDGLKVYLHEVDGPPVQDIWTDIGLAPTDSERLGYPTQKPVALVDRIIRASTPPNGLVLDCFMGRALPPRPRNASVATGSGSTTASMRSTWLENGSFSFTDNPSRPRNRNTNTSSAPSARSWSARRSRRRRRTRSTSGPSPSRTSASTSAPSSGKTSSRRRAGTATR